MAGKDNFKIVNFRLNLEKNPSTVPTGHIVLHQVLPFLHANAKMTTNVTAAIMNVGRDLSHTSVL